MAAENNITGYTIEELKLLRDREQNLLTKTKEELETAREYERVNTIIEERFIKRYGENVPHKYGGRYGDLYKRPDFPKWKGTFFDKERLLIEEQLVRKVKPLSRIPSLLNGECDIPELNGLNLPIKAYIMGYCDYSKGTKNGPVLHLIEPDGEYTTPPHLGMPDEMSKIYEGKICIVLLQFQKGTVPMVLSVTTLPFTLTEKILPGSKEADNLTEPPAPLECISTDDDLFDLLDM